MKLEEKYVAVFHFLLRVGSVKSHHPLYPWDDFLWPYYCKGGFSGKTKRELCVLYHCYSNRIEKGIKGFTCTIDKGK
jgi:hypothetical protein